MNIIEAISLVSFIAFILVMWTKAKRWDDEHQDPPTGAWT